MGSSSSSSSSWLVYIGLGAASEWRDELPPSREQRERVNFRSASEANSSRTIIGQHEQLGDGLVKPNEILTELAPPMINISATLGESTWHLNLEQ
jgi:hypothetical protein